MDSKMTSRGTGAGRRFLPKSSLSIYDLDSDIASKIKRALDTATQDRNWRAFIVAMVDKFNYSQCEIETFGLAATQTSGSPAGKLWNDLASKGFKVKDLIHYLDKLQWERLLYDLKPYEAIKVLSDPPEKVKVYVGETLMLTVKATGFPYPRYQWFRGDNHVQGKDSTLLKIENVTLSDEGLYCCRLHNSADLDKVVFTKNTAVTVRGSPQQGGWPEHPGITPENNAARSPQIVFETRDTSINVNVDEPFILQCKAVGTGPLEYRWLKNGQLQPCISQDYMVQRCSIVDSGSYECLVKNQYGETKSKLFIVRVVVKSTPPAAPSPKQSMLSQLSNLSKGAFDNLPSSLDIIAQPKSCTIERGGSALFSCQVLGEPPITYQWYKDGRLIPEENQDHLAIRMVNSYEQEACFQCRVSNRYSEVISAGAFLRLDVEQSNSPHNSVSKYTATDKIALLIGNYDYMSADTLKAPKTDVLVLAELFKGMDFKVVSLLNLTLEEMEAAVKEFCHLLQGERKEGSGMYGVFYFCGHGIEEKGQCYLVPQDAPTGYSASNCLCAQKVLHQMQLQNPAVCTMMLDCCRIEHPNPPMEILKSYLPLPYGNMIWLYATTQGMRAWEYDYEEEDYPNYYKEPNGVLVKHLQPHLCRRKPIEAIFSNLRVDISAHPKLRKCQIPEIKTNLTEPERSLADKIVYTGYTEMFSRRQMRWKNAHQKPVDCSVYIKPLEVTVGVEYQADFSNVMSIYLTVNNPGVTKGCHAWVVNIPPTLSVMKDPVSLNPFRTKTVIQDIQKLKQSLSFNIKLQYTMEDSVDVFYHEHGPIEVGFPLISTLELWKGDPDLIRQNSQHREPTEQGEDCHMIDPPSYVNLQPQYENIPPLYQNVPGLCTKQ